MRLTLILGTLSNLSLCTLSGAAESAQPSAAFAGPAPAPAPATTALPAPATAPAPATVPAPAMAPADTAAPADAATPIGPAVPAPSAPSSPLVWQVALADYERGATEQAISLVQKEIVSCTVTGEKQCFIDEVGTMYAVLGIALAGGRNDHKASVQAFQRALELSPQIVIYPAYQSAPVMRAFNEAKAKPLGATHFPPATATAEDLEEQRAEAAEDAEAAEEAIEKAVDLLKQRGVLLLSAGVQLGTTSLYLPQIDDSYYSSPYYEDFTVRPYARATFGLMPARRVGFTIGGRVEGGAVYVARRAFGQFATSLVLGSTVGKRQDNTFAYFFGTVGGSFLVSNQRWTPTFGFQGGFSFSGLQIGVSSDLAVSDNYSAILFGLELGWGALFL